MMLAKAGALSRWREWCDSLGPFILTLNKELYQEKENCGTPRLAVSLQHCSTRAFLAFSSYPVHFFITHICKAGFLMYLQHAPSMAMLVTAWDFLEHSGVFPQALASPRQSPDSLLSHPACPRSAAAHHSVKQLCMRSIASCEDPVSIATLLAPLTGICC